MSDLHALRADIGEGPIALCDLAGALDCTEADAVAAIDAWDRGRNWNDVARPPWLHWEQPADSDVITLWIGSGDGLR